jgi:hypothetical protein
MRVAMTGETNTRAQLCKAAAMRDTYFFGTHLKYNFIYHQQSHLS